MGKKCGQIRMWPIGRQSGNLPPWSEFLRHSSVPSGELKSRKVQEFKSSRVGPQQTCLSVVMPAQACIHVRPLKGYQGCQRFQGHQRWLRKDSRHSPSVRNPSVVIPAKAGIHERPPKGCQGYQSFQGYQGRFRKDSPHSPSVRSPSIVMPAQAGIHGRPSEPWRGFPRLH